MRKTLILPLALAAALGTAGCTGMSDTEQRTATGAAIGAGSGLVIGSLFGKSGWGALAGAGAGALGGYLFDQHKQAEQQAYARGLEDGRRGR
jgi:uncharacterized membrane protein